MTANIFFTSPEHRTRWLTAILTIQKTWEGKLDPEYASALYILTSGTGTWQKAESYVDLDGIDFEGLLAGPDWSGAYSMLLMLAANLFNGQTACSPVELMRLDDRNFEIAMCAFRIRRTAPLVSDLTSKAELSNIELDIRNRITVENRTKPWLPLQPREEL